MSVTRPKIDKYEFLALHRSDDQRAGPVIVREQCQPINRPGVNGTAVLLTGQRADAFQMRSLVDMTSLATLPAAIKAYSELIGTVVEIEWQGVDFAVEHDTKYVVMDVVQLRSGRLSARAGGLVSNSTAYLELLWTFQPVVA